MENEIDNILKKYVNEVEDLKKELEIAQKDANRQHDLNLNLLRIARERANSKRGIQNKKKHLGYIVMNSRQYTQKYKEYNGNIKRSREVMTWKTTIQTPYDASLSINQIKEEIINDLLHNGVLSALEVRQYNNAEAFNGNGEYRVFVDKKGNTVNGIYNTQFNANYKSGFWEIDVFHTKNVTVPEEMRPFKRK